MSFLQCVRGFCRCYLLEQYNNYCSIHLNNFIENYFKLILPLLHISTKEETPCKWSGYWNTVIWERSGIWLLCIKKKKIKCCNIRVTETQTVARWEQYSTEIDAIHCTYDCLNFRYFVSQYLMVLFFLLLFLLYL